MLLCNVFHLSVSNSMPKRLDGSGPNFSMATYMTTVRPRKNFSLYNFLNRHLFKQKNSRNIEFYNPKKWSLDSAEEKYKFSIC